MEPRIETLSEKKLVGKRLKMSLNNNRTVELWKSFMPDRRLIPNKVSSEFFSMQVYDQAQHDLFSPETEFVKWAAVEVTDHNAIPEGMEAYTLSRGLYTVFIHKGLPREFPKTAQYIFGVWLPASDYELDQREHFELLGDKYKNNEPDSEEEVWIPIRKKTH